MLSLCGKDTAAFREASAPDAAPATLLAVPGTPGAGLLLLSVSGLLLRRRRNPSRAAAM